MGHATYPYRLVGYWFLISGIATLMSLIGGVLTQDTLTLSTGLLALPIGAGLLAQPREAWRRAGVIYCVLSFTVLAIAIALLITPAATHRIHFSGSRGQPVSALVLFVVATGLTVWSYRILTAPSTKALFGASSEEHPAA